MSSEGRCLSSDGLGARVEGVRVRSNEGRGVRLGGRIELWEGVLEGVRVLGSMADGIATCDTTGRFSLWADDVLGRPVTGMGAVD